MSNNTNTFSQNDSIEIDEQNPTLDFLKKTLKSRGFTPWAFLLLTISLLIGLRQVPLVFSTDEAAPLVFAANQLDELARPGEYHPIPVYYSLDRPLEYGSRVFLSALPYISFGREIWVVRGISVAAVLLGAWFLAAILRTFFQLKSHWLVYLLLAATPAWLLLGRTGNNVIITISAGIAAIFFYWQYRFRDPRFLFYTVPLASLILYADAQGLVLLAGSLIVLLIFDLRYHWQQRGTVMQAALLGVLFLFPLIFHFWQHGEDFTSLWQLVNSRLLENSTGFAPIYLGFFDLSFWFFPNQWLNQVPARFFIGALPYFLPIFLPFLFIGFWQSLRNFSNQPVWRYVWISLIFLPFSRFLGEPDLIGMAPLLVPITIWTVQGLQTGMDWWQKKGGQNVQQWIFSFGVFASLFVLFFSGLSYRQWLKEVPIESSEFGTDQVFNMAADLLTHHTRAKFSINKDWNEHPEILRQFFIPDNHRIEYNLINSFEEYAREDLEDYYFFISPKERAYVCDSNKFQCPSILQNISTPDGRDAYYLVQIQYSDQIKEILTEEIQKRKQLITETVTWQGQQLTVRHPLLQSGTIADLFDQNNETLIKTDRVNPLNIEITFTEPISLSALQFNVGVEELSISVVLVDDHDQPILTFNKNIPAADQNRSVQVDFSNTYKIRQLNIFIQDRNAPESAPVHLWEISFLNQNMQE